MSDPNRYLRQKAEKLKIQKENPSLWTGIRKPGQPSKIFNRAEAEAEYQSNIEAARILAKNKAVELEGGTPTGQPSGAPAGQPSGAPTGQPSGAPTGQPSGVAPTSRLDASPTPRLDAQRPSPTSAAAPKRETFAEADARTRREKTLSGAFGEQAQKRAENLEGRKGLFAEMKASSQKSGGDIPVEDMTRFGEQAKKLGIAEENFERTAFRVEGGKFPAPTAPAPAAPLTGRALAEKNIAEKGIQGAAADYFKRAEAEKVALEKRSPLNTVSSRFAEKATSPVPASRKTFAQTFGSEMDRGEPSPALKAARENTIAARTKADTMRAEYEQRKIREDALSYYGEQSAQWANLTRALKERGMSSEAAKVEASRLQERNRLMNQSRGEVDPRFARQNPGLSQTDEKSRARALRLADTLRTAPAPQKPTGEYLRNR